MNRFNKLNEIDLTSTYKAKLQTQLAEFLAELESGLVCKMPPIHIRFDKETKNSLGQQANAILRKYPDLRRYMKKTEGCGFWIGDEPVNGSLDFKVFVPGLIDEKEEEIEKEKNG